MIRRIAAALLCLAWALWFGGLGTLFLLVTRLFRVDRPVALQAAPPMFLVFEKYQIVLAATAITGAAAWRITVNTTRAAIVFWLLAAAGVGAALGPIFITRPLEQLRIAGETSSPQFRKLHGRSMILYSTETLILLAAGVALSSAVAHDDARIKT